MVQFTQFLRPRGERAPVFIDLDPETEARAQEIIDQKLRFECEVLMNGMCHFTITGHSHEIGEEQDLAHKFCSNGPPVPIMVKDLIMEFDLQAYKEGRI